MSGFTLFSLSIRSATVSTPSSMSTLPRSVTSSLSRIASRSAVMVSGSSS